MVLRVGGDGKISESLEYAMECGVWNAESYPSAKRDARRIMSPESQI